MRDTHRHRAIEDQTKVRAYSGPITGAEENHAAHGNIRQVQVCRCGAQRLRNVNHTETETGPWAPPIHPELETQNV